jgi:hypothetical protein
MVSPALKLIVSPRRCAGVTRFESTKIMLDRTERRLGLKPKRLAADTANGISRFLDWLVSRRIAPHIPVRDARQRDDGTFSIIQGCRCSAEVLPTSGPLVPAVNEAERSRDG